MKGPETSSLVFFNQQSTIINHQSTIALFYPWILFNLFAVGVLVLDLRVFHRTGHATRPREALGWSALYILLAAAFAVLLYFWLGHQAALEFVTGYVLEFSLSVDNLFLFLIIFNYFAAAFACA